MKKKKDTLLTNNFISTIYIYKNYKYYNSGNMIDFNSKQLFIIGGLALILPLLLITKN